MYATCMLNFHELWLSILNLMNHAHYPARSFCVLIFQSWFADQGVNTPDSILQISCLTPKDREDLDFMLNIGDIDWIALSFVQRPEDIVEITRLIIEHNPNAIVRPKIMAKIEKPSCFEGGALKKIIELCDGIMVARGDLGVECAPEDVPMLQKEIIDECRNQGKPVVVATVRANCIFFARPDLSLFFRTHYYALFL